MTRVLPGMSGVFLAVVMMALVAGLCGACAGAEESGRAGLVVPDSTQASPTAEVEPSELSVTALESAAELGSAAAAAGVLAASQAEPPAVAEATPASDLIVVYITKTGSKYHLA